MGVSTVNREHKGKSIIVFPHDYTIVDLETTGFSPKYDEIIELGAIKVRNNEIVDTFSKLIRPGIALNPFIQELTGITDEMLEYAATLDDVIDEFIEFIGDDIVVGHNVGFDVNFIYDNLLRLRGTYFSNDSVNTLRISKKLIKDLRHHSLYDLCLYYGIEEEKGHRSLVDCKTTYQLFNILKKQVEAQYNSFDDFYNSFKKNSNYSRINYSKIINELQPSVDDIDETNFFFDKTCVFTGALEKMTRVEAAQIVVNLGGNVGNGVTKSTNFLILGNNDYCKSIKDGKSNKQKKAEQLILAGADLKIISEDVFYSLIFEE